MKHRDRLVKYTHQIFANKRDNLEDIRLLHTNLERQKTHIFCGQTSGDRGHTSPADKLYFIFWETGDTCLLSTNIRGRMSHADKFLEIEDANLLIILRGKY